MTDQLPYCSLLIFPLFFIIFPLFTFDWSSVDEIVFSKRQLSVYIHKPAIKDPVEIDNYCPLVSKDLVDKSFIDQYPFKANLTHYQVSEAFWIQPGGSYKPKDCISRNKVAILIPVQNRDDQLYVLASYLHTFLNAQLIDYTLFVVELSKENKKWNKGALYNAGFKEINKLDKFDCFIFHDVDLLPESQLNIYSCFDNPRHLSVHVNSFRYHLPYRGLFGGVFAMMSNDFIKINGISNKFNNWGGEDDSLFQRLQFFNYTIIRSYDLGYYTMLPHSHQTINEDRNKLIKDSIEQIDHDGLNSIDYKVLDVKRDYLYTKFLIQLKV